MDSESTFSFTLATRLGTLAITASASGLHRMRFDDDARAEAPPSAQAREAIPELDSWTTKIAGYYDGRPADIESIPLEAEGTSFQKRVWRALRAIPRGETRSYAEIARAIGLPEAARAVARACGANPITLLIPCHRVIASDGSLGGYRWGTRRKARLLAMERAARADELPLESGFAARDRERGTHTRDAVHG